MTSVAYPVEHVGTSPAPPVGRRLRWSPTGRHRVTSLVLVLPLVALMVWAYVADGPAGATHGRVPEVAVLAVAGGWFAALWHGFVETQSAPTGAAEIAGRLRRGRLLHALTLAGLGAGSLLLMVWASDSPPLAVTSFVLAAGLLLRPAARGRRAATALARDLDRVLRLHDAQTLPGRPPTAPGWREALDELLISGSTGIDSGVAVGWWGLRAVHPHTLRDVAATADAGRLPPGLAETLAAYRTALGTHLDAAA